MPQHKKQVAKAFSAKAFGLHANKQHQCMETVSQWQKLLALPALRVLVIIFEEAHIEALISC